MQAFLKSVLGAKGIDPEDTAAVGAIFTLLKSQIKSQTKEYKKVLDLVQEDDDLTDDEKQLFVTFSGQLDGTIESAEKILDMFERKVTELAA